MKNTTLSTERLRRNRISCMDLFLDICFGFSNSSIIYNIQFAKGNMNSNDTIKVTVCRPLIRTIRPNDHAIEMGFMVNF